MESITGRLDSFLDFVVLIIKIVVGVFGFLAGARVGSWLTPKKARADVRAFSVVLCGSLGFLLLWWAINRVDRGRGSGGPGSGGGAGAGTTNQPEATGKNPPTEEKSLESASARIRMLGGSRVQEQRFYLLEGDKPLSWLELVNELELCRRSRPSLKTIEIVIFKNSVDRDNPAVKQLEAWAQERAITITISAPASDGP